MGDRVDQFRAFVAVSEQGGFTAAAQSMGLTQSTVSKLIAQLEGRLGAPLFRRSTRSLRLTAAGERLIEPVRDAIRAVADAERAITDADPLSGRIHLTAPPTLAMARIMPMLALFQHRYPAIAIESRFVDARTDLVRDGIDLAVRVGALGGAHGRRIGTARRMLAASPAYLDTHGRPVAPADLAAHDCLTFTLLERGRVWEFEGGESVAVSGSFASNDPGALRLAALSGRGIVLSASWLFEADLASGALERVLPGQVPLAMPIHLVMRQSGPPPPRLRLLADFLTARFAEDASVAP